MAKKQAKKLVDSRYLKILSTKKADLKDAIVFICLDEEKYGRLDKSSLRSIAKQIEAIEPDAVYVPVVKKMNIQIMDRAQFTNKNVVVFITHQSTPSTEVRSNLEDQVKQALPNVKSISVIHEGVNIQIK
ncbi:hypothetical protein LCGC14_2685230 [marine sediment metagenome]|uniref:Uncharacterized protein n=1 Tax=marine sediment metagenome TaxID=412755 RepID=A0A0F9CBW4_9ZZZZ